MNYRLQVIPLSSVSAGGSCSFINPKKVRTPQETQFFRSWLAYDFESEFIGRQRLNWNALVGLFFAVGVSASFWAAAGLLAARLWR